MSLWLDLEIVRNEWPDALVSDEALTAVLETAQTQIIAYAPASLTEPLDSLVLPVTLDGQGEEQDGPLPAQLRTALLMQAREIWRAGERDGDTIGIGDYTVRAPDMTNSVKKVLRPRRALGVIA